MLGIQAQNTILGKFTYYGIEREVVDCEDFTSFGVVFQDFASMKNRIIDSATNGYETELSDILETIEPKYD